jgi:2,4-dienoyl-CoA reductase (NADPH2)
VFSAHLTNYATQDGRPSEQHAAYYAARAAGGAGLIITE